MIFAWNLLLRLLSDSFPHSLKLQEVIISRERQLKSPFLLESSSLGIVGKMNMALLYGTRRNSS